MTYLIFGKKIEIHSMKGQDNQHGGSFEFTGSKSLNKIGLKQTFWFRGKCNFSNDGPIDDIREGKEAKTPEKRVLANYLNKCIRNHKLTEQFAF